jgi:hypothetical protein
MVDAVKLLEQLREEIRKENPDYSEKEISAYVAGMIRGLDMRNSALSIKED